ncbi:hypothetical protein [Clostridium sp.]|uniref:hypothetical protein n=1 Tax=Clostridium sp. TaxID=1506 RepID=UPI0032180749
MYKLKEYIKENFILIGIIVLFMAFILPMILDVLDLGKCIPFYKNVSPDGWLGFITALLGFSGIFITIRHTNKQFNEDKRISVKPYLDLSISKVIRPKLGNDLYTAKDYSFSYSGNIWINADSGLGCYDLQCRLDIKNLGMGNALDCRILSVRPTSPFDIEDNRVLGVIEPNKSGEISINIKYYDDDSKNKVLTVYKEFNKSEQIYEYINNQTTRDIILLIEYKDILNNCYKKEFTLKCNLAVYLESYNDTIKEIKDMWLEITVDKERFKEEYIGIKKS